jgi:murein DD-endopeptidase MepM/ murein hydrolase activator NlpD
MRRLTPPACALAVLVCAPAAALASDPPTGGAAAPGPGAVSYGQPVAKAPRRPARPVAKRFTVAPATLVAGSPATFTFRVDGRMPKVRVRILLTRTGAAKRVAVLRLGYRRTRRLHTHVWTPPAGALAPGDYAVTLQAFDAKGRALRRTARASGRAPLAITVPPPPAPPPAAGVFPVRGPYDLGGADARFGAGRPGHIHQGQDVTAAQGTPVVAPVAGTAWFIDVQKGGAGHYVVLRAADGVDYVFMHLVKGSITVAEGGRLAAGQAFAQVGSTGASSGPHLHFEIWPDGWYSSKASKPIDPLPQLQAWAAAGG